MSRTVIRKALRPRAHVILSLRRIRNSDHGFLARSHEYESGLHAFHYQNTVCYAALHSTVPIFIITGWPRGQVLLGMTDALPISRRWYYSRGYQGLAYQSRHETGRTCWALFEGAVFRPVGEDEPLLPDDSPLLAVAGSLTLSVRAG